MVLTETNGTTASQGRGIAVTLAALVSKPEDTGKVSVAKWLPLIRTT